MFKNTKLANSVKLALTIGAVASFGLANPAFSQEEEETVEKISVTGSRLQSVNIESSSPVVTVDSALFDIRGTTDTVDLLNTLPSFFAAQTTAFANGATGTSTANLRGLGSQRTLVLVDGKRLPPGGPLAGWASDLNLIAPQMVDRVDVVTGGASAVYGSDAIAGVVNFVTRKDFEGVEVDLQYGFNQTINDSDFWAERLEAIGETPAEENRVDNDTFQVNMMMGTGLGDGSGNITAYFNYAKNSGIQQANRDFAQCATFPITNADGENDLICLGSNQGPFPTTFVVDGVGYSLQSDNSLVQGFTNAYNFNPFNPVRRAVERFNIGFSGYYDVSDNVTTYMDFGFTSSNSPQVIAPSAAFGSTINQVNCDNPLLTDEMRTIICGSASISGPWPRDEDGDGYAQSNVRRRFVEGGGRTDDRTRTNFRSVFGVKGVIDDALDWDLFGQYSETRLTRVQYNQVTLSNLQNALDIVSDPVTGEPACRVAVEGTDSSCIPFVTAYDATADFDPALQTYLDTPTLTVGTGTQTIFGGTFGGDLGKYGVQSPMADEAINILVGFEYRRDELYQQADGIASSGNLVGSGGATVPIDGETTVREVFTEAQIPLLSGVTGAEQLNLTAAYRYSEYESFNALLGEAGGEFDTNTWALGLSWIPVEDVTVRTQMQRAVRAPNVIELFSPQNSGLTGLSDPCSGTSPSASQSACANTGLPASLYGSVPPDSGQLNTLTGGNPDLTPEESDTFTFGVIYQPSQVEGLSVSVDYFDIVVENAIGTIPTATTLEQCLNGLDEFCALIQRGPDGSLTYFPREEAFIQATSVNVAEFSTKGVDVQVIYDLDVEDYGSFSFNYNSTFLLEWNAVNLPGTAEYDCAGFYASSCGNPNAEYRHNFVMSWDTPWDVRASLVWRHISAVDQVGSVDNGFISDGSTGAVTSLVDEGFNAIDEEIEAVSYLDLTLFYQLNDNVSFRAGVNNLLDQDPPIVTTFGVAGVNVEANTVAGVYDAAGRFIFFGSTLTF